MRQTELLQASAAEFASARRVLPARRDLWSQLGLLSGWLLLVLLPAGAEASSSGQVLDDIALPGRSEVAWVATNINQNGLAMAIQTFSSPMAVADVLEFYRQQWAQAGGVPGYVENQAGGWQVISQLAGDHNVVLQLMQNDRGGSRGFLSSVALHASHGADMVDLQLPPNTELVSNSRVVDGNRVSVTRLLISNAGNGIIVEFYKDNLQRSGWKLTSDRKHEGHRLLFFNKKNARCELVVSTAADGSSVISMNQVQTND